MKLTIDLNLTDEQILNIAKEKGYYEMITLTSTDAE
jgi:hypothetical protein